MMTLKRAKQIMLDSKDIDTFYDTDTELDDLDDIANGKPLSCEVDVTVPNSSQYKRSSAEMKFVHENHRKYHLDVRRIIIGALMKDNYGNNYVPLYVSYIQH